MASERIVGDTASTIDATSPAWQRKAHEVANARWFQSLVVAVIVANAVALGLQTYQRIPGELQRIADPLDSWFLAFFVFELLIRLAAYRFRVIRFLRDPWNVFDTFVIVLGLLPVWHWNPTALRMVRLARIARLARVMPDFRVLVDGLRRAALPALSLLALMALLCYLYAVVGYMIFNETAPEYFGNLGEGMLTLFTLLTLEGWNEIMYVLRDASPWALPYVISFILLGTYVVINLVIGIVINALETAYKERDRDDAADPELADTINELQEVIDKLERKLAGLDAKYRRQRET
ncbi:ion transporter [Granulicoccus sp. GXG6511]|uniref:ion transporter n=1 Tax=Granulicoccus sp. GXG6511 TaxID=3381351 RepID=UPI003D7E970D